MSSINLSVYRTTYGARWVLRSVHSVYERQNTGSIFGWERRGEVHDLSSTGETDVIRGVLEDVLGRLGQSKVCDD